VRNSKEARKTEQARRLAMEADKIAQILNDDFRKISDRLHEIRAAESRKGAAQAKFGSQQTDQGNDDWVRGTKTPGFILKANPEKTPCRPSQQARSRPKSSLTAGPTTWAI
jgi:hypothetical protein